VEGGERKVESEGVCVCEGGGGWGETLSMSSGAMRLN